MEPITGIATDEELATCIAEMASEEACTELFQRYNRRIYLWCFNYTHDMEDAVDLTQEIFIKIFKNISSFSGLSSFSTWVYKVTRNHCLGELSRKRTQWRKRTISIDDGYDFDKVQDESSRDIELAGDLERILEMARETIRGDELEAFILHYWEGLTVNEITRILGCENASGARVLIQNARRKFRSLIKEKDYFNG
jgi:RNA polymerase sigma factor (sigma-70 family)